MNISPTAHWGQRLLLIAGLLSALTLVAGNVSSWISLGRQVSKVPRANMFKITIDRKLKGANCTQGYLLVNDSAMAYSLELPDKNNRDYISSIPKDTYSAIIRTDGAKGWRIELEDVPSREDVQIHVGNFTREIEGCILIGTKVDIDNCSVLNSYRHEAMKKLQSKLNQFTRDLILNQENPKPVQIEVEITGI